MLTFTRSSPDRLSSGSIRSHASGLASNALAPVHSLQQSSFRQQNRSSAAQPDAASATSARTRQAATVLVLRGRNVSAVKIAGNATPVVTSVRGMHNGGTWSFFGDGRFRFMPRGLGTLARTDLFPVDGTYRVAGNTIRVDGSRSSADLTSRNSVTIDGRITVQNGGIRATIFQRTTIISAAFVNGTPFGSTLDRTVRLKMNMVRIS